MISKAATPHLTALIVIAVLMIASDLLAFEQGGRSGSERQSPASASQAEELFQDALLLSANKESESARLQLQKAMRIWMQRREPDKAAKAALQMGDLCKRDRNYKDALDYYEQALDIKSAPGAVRANALNAIALIYADLYHHKLAARFFNRALDQARIAEDIPAQTLALSGLADIYQQQGANDKALGCISRALRLSRRGQAVADPALLYLRGRISQDQGRVEQAKDDFDEALTSFENAGDVAGQVRVLCALSSLSLHVSRKQEALERAKRAVELADAQGRRAASHAEHVNARQLRWPARLSLARAERALGQKERARDHYKRALSLFAVTWWAVNIATEAGAVANREVVQAAYREYVDLLMEQGEFMKAFDLADEAKARVTLTLITARRVSPPTEDSSREAALRELDRSIARLRLQLLASDLTPEQQAKLQKEIEKAEFEMLIEQSRAEIEHSRKRLVWADLAKAEQLKKQMASDQMALAEFSLGEDRSFVWLFTGGEVLFHILPPRKEIEREVRDYLDTLAARPNSLNMERGLTRLKTKAEALFTRLFSRLAGRIEPGRQLIVVPDGLLHYLPFETLIRNGRYLIEDNEISYSPSASLLGLWKDSGTGGDSGDRLELLAVGNPVFEPKTGPRNPAQQAVSARGFLLPQLPMTQDEVQHIAELFPVDRRRVLLGRESTEAALKREPLGRYRRLHFATHSLIDEMSPSRSAIALSFDGDAEEDGLLDVSEIARLNLDADLAVVSACQTGRGKLLSGEGIVGLSRAFLQAGARSVVVSLWEVTDISTSQLMRNFYKHLTGGLGNAAALRRAKLHMIGSPKQSRHPFYWSSFVMVGKP